MPVPSIRHDFQIPGVLTVDATELMLLQPRTDAAKVISGTATGGSTSTVITTITTTANQYVGRMVKMTGGTAANIGQVRYIDSHTTGVNATFTIKNGAAGYPLFPAAVANNDTFEIYEPSSYRPVITSIQTQISTASGVVTHRFNSGGSEGVGTQPNNNVEMYRHSGATVLFQPANLGARAELRGSRGGGISAVASAAGPIAGTFFLTGYWAHRSEAGAANS